MGQTYCTQAPMHTHRQLCRPTKREVQRGRTDLWTQTGTPCAPVLGPSKRVTLRRCLRGAVANLLAGCSTGGDCRRLQPNGGVVHSLRESCLEYCRTRLDWNCTHFKRPQGIWAPQPVVGLFSCGRPQKQICISQQVVWYHDRAEKRQEW
jgi:hypothetical protein